LLHVFPAFAVGGAQVRFCAVANRFGRRWRHAIVSMNGDLTCRERLSPDLDVRFPDVAAPKAGLVATVKHLRAVLQALRPDVLVTSNWGSIEWALANAPPGLPRVCRHVHTEDGFGPEERDRQLPRRVWTRRLALRRSIIVLPSRVLLRIATQVWRLPSARVRYVPNGIDLARFAPVPARDGPAVVGTVAALRPEKALGRLLRAFAQAAPPGSAARLTLVGDGPERAALESLAASLGLANRIAFAGHRADAERLYAGFDVFALSSDTEQMPLSVLEAMAAGLPVAATDVGDVADMVAPENRRFIVPKDEAALAGALTALLAAPPLRRELGQANRARAQTMFDQETMFQAYAGLWDQET
jgi:glycosyltransferase involved in cell wall biosynthesis